FNCLWGIVGGRLDRADLFGDSNDFVGSRQHVLVIDIDDRTHRTSAVKSVDPFLESVRIGLDPLLDELLQGGSACDAAEEIGELFVGHEELLARYFTLVYPVVGLEVSRRQQGHQQPGGIGFGEAHHVLIDIDATALLKSRLTVAKARPTSPSPAVKVSPLATKPTTGMSAKRTMRVRTEKEASMRASRLNGSDSSIGRMRFGSHPREKPTQKQR